MQHLARAVDPHAHGRAVVAGASLDLDHAVGETHALRERRERKRRVARNAHAAELEQALDLAEGVGVREKEEQVALRVKPRVRAEGAVSDRHRPRFVAAGRSPRDIVRGEFGERARGGRVARGRALRLDRLARLRGTRRHDGSGDDKREARERREAPGGHGWPSSRRTAEVSLDPVVEIEKTQQRRGPHFARVFRAAAAPCQIGGACVRPSAGQFTLILRGVGRGVYGTVTVSTPSARSALMPSPETRSGRCSARRTLEVGRSRTSVRVAFAAGG